MLYYKSSLGCVEYYDNVLHEPSLCDPTMLFILGLEAITTSINEYYTTDAITGKSIVDESRLYNIILYRDRVGGDKFFTNIKDYLSLFGNPIVYSDKLELYCAGLKLFMSQLTGTSHSRSVPAIFHNALDISVLGLDGYSDHSEICSKTIHALDNSGCKNQIYKKFDNKSMYSYALGVLFGCQCLGYDEYKIYRESPHTWYTGEYSNLVMSAYSVFNFHHYRNLCCIDNDKKLRFKYHGIQFNKLWNFKNETFYDISIEASDHGYILTNREKSPASRTIVIESYPDDGYELDHVVASFGSGSLYIDGSYFIMPDNHVILRPFFIERI